MCQLFAGSNECSYLRYQSKYASVHDIHDYNYTPRNSYDCFFYPSWYKINWRVVVVEILS